MPLFSDADGGARADARGLLAFSSEARKGMIRGTGCALFAFPDYFQPDGLEETCALEVSLSVGGDAPADVKLSFLTGDDFSSAFFGGDKLRRRLSDYRKQGDAFYAWQDNSLFASSAILKEASGAVSLRLAFPASSVAVRGFAVSVAADSPDTEVAVYHASVREASAGWIAAGTPGLLEWAGFPESGGMAEARFDPEQPPAVELPGEGYVSFLFDAIAPADGGTPASLLSARQPRAVFTDGRRQFGFRLSPDNRGISVFQPCVLAEFSGTVASVSGGTSVLGMYTSLPAEMRASAFAGQGLGVPGEALLAPIPADPHAVVEWRQSEWRKPEREVFCWDRFPSVLFFDTADYDVQDRYFRRLAFFVEKQGYKGRLLTDAELADKHGFNAHDYRPESLAEFFTAAAATDFPLLDEELELRGILLHNGIIEAAGDGGFVPGKGAVVSISRSSPGYLRYFLMAHEGFHAVYFIDGDFRRKVSEVYATMPAPALDFLHDYFTVVDSLGYDTSDRFLMENECMAYLLQNAPANVARYFSENLAGRYLRYGGNPALAAYVMDTGAADFVAAAEELTRYVYNRWGMSGGRIGMLFWDD